MLRSLHIGRVRQGAVGDKHRRGHDGNLVLLLPCLPPNTVKQGTRVSALSQLEGHMILRSLLAATATLERMKPFYALLNIHPDGPNDVKWVLSNDSALKRRLDRSISTLPMRYESVPAYLWRAESLALCLVPAPFDKSQALSLLHASTALHTKV